METDLEVRGVRLSASVLGQGSRAFVWGHGLSSDRAAEDALGLFDLDPVSDRLRVVRYDARGHGRSADPGDPSAATWPELARDMLGVADAVGVERFVAGGASMGCATALHAAVVAPERIEGLVLVIPPTAWETRAAQAATYSAGVSLLRAQPERAIELMASAVETFAPLGAVVSAGYPEAAAVMKEHLLGLDPVRLADVFEGAARSDLPNPDSIARLSQPTVILAWEGDPGHPVSTAQRLHELIRGSELHVAGSVDDVRRWPEIIGRWVDG